MQKISLKKAVALATLAGAASLAQAVTIEYGTLVTGDGPASASFATLTVENIAGGDDLSFTLNAFGLDVFGANAFLGALGLDATFAGTVQNVSGDAPVSLANSGGPLGVEFRFDLTGPQQARLTDNETVSWIWADSGTTAESLQTVLAHVQGIGPNASESAWYGPNGPVANPIPEPETYALMLAGLGVVGYMARRRRMVAS